MTLSERITELAATAQTLAPQVAALEASAAEHDAAVDALEAQVASLHLSRAAAVEALDVLMILAQAYLSAPNGEDADEADALVSFLEAHTTP